MANYNPHAPYIIGNEWVPIRQADYPPDDNITERGYTFRLEHATVPVTGAYYVESVPANRLSQVCDFMAVYPTGRETLTGPIKRLFIPASAVAATGPNLDISAGAAALQSPTDEKFIIFSAPGGSDLQVNFNTANYSQQLFGKRILDITIRYVLFGDPLESFNMRLDVSQPDVAGESVRYASALTIATATSAIDIVKPQYSTVSLTDLNPFWDTNIFVNRQRNILPWRFQELNLFRSGAAANDRLIVVMDNISLTTSVFLAFMDMQVTYCEETRVRYGGRRTANQSATSGLFDPDDYGIGQNIVRLYDTNFVNTSTLAAGNYTVTLKHVNLSPFTVLSGEPTVRAVRPYYDLDLPTPIRINTTLTPDEQFSLGDESVLTHLTLHTSNTIVTGSHAYGTRYGAPVYGTVTATQEIEDDPVGTSRTYQQVRFYARRYGNTTTPLTLTDVATGLSTVSITPGEFDALPEIVDGWREVTLRFTTPPSFATAAGDVDWRWSATGELAGNQWQVMVADGPSTSVITPASLASALATGKATYYAPQGDTVALTWQSPTISGTAEDSPSDAVLLFSQDPPSVSGFALEVLSQEVTGIGLDCGTPPDCVPTGISYVQTSWQLNAVCDDFERDETGEWGTSTSGHTITTTGGAAVNYRVADGVGILNFTSVNLDLAARYGVSVSDVIMRGTFKNDVTPTGAIFEVKIQARYVNSSNFIDARLALGTSGSVIASIRQVVAGVETNSGFPVVSGITVTDELDWLFSVVGTSLQFKVWRHVDPEPVAWSTTLTTSWLTAGDVGLAGFLSSSVSNALPIVYEFDNFTAIAPELQGATVELQRLDSYDSTWHTIMLSSTPCPHSFSDFEARVGVESQYRVRVLNVLDFAGAWVTGSATIPAPGVDGAADGNSVLIFTSNESPSSSLAYVMQWENTPVETFMFPEADFVQLQRIFGRDYFTAFYPLERGGEQFTRTLLMNAAAITPQSLANFRGLRDLAWAQVNYVCVRDELGNRWFANIRVPDGVVRNNRTAYLAQVQVTQVTDTPTPVDPVGE